ncbi:TolC family protein [Salmonella enterica]|uniref:TolC family protein n=1 Tax=Salmonella enterica TaxID=28901 RepID=UPI0010799339|nr:TolC family protein [Salmonella enterica]EAA3133234.1 hypothetical protein [Salmonella enterica subsp. enterica serovar Chester]EGE9388321.1 TolC family protein [Salmonella enterica subsp. enterica serovar Bredeney]EDH8245927.1 hypothetical protein [Salmonella enterica subsp. enterica serovar Chester]EGL8376094.1 TolC family protein [Salmonella enterica]EIT1500676.1 TolC family protein [Salmonella enterica]
MKLLVFLIATFIVCNTNASSNPHCELEDYFKHTDSYKSSMMDNEVKQLEMERESLSLLPDVSLSLGQQSTNRRSFKGMSDSAVSLGLSQSVYNGNRYNRFKDKIAIEKEYINLMLHEKRNRYLVDLYRAVIDYKYKSDLYKLYDSQLNKQIKQLESAKERLASGNIAKIEFDIVHLRNEELRNEVDTIQNEVLQAEQDIKTQFNIPVDVIKKITSKKIISCKGKDTGTSFILNKSRKLLKQNENANFQLTMASTQPTVSVSLSVRPPSDGTLNDFSTKKTEFAAAITVDIPLSSYFSVINTKKEHAISIKRIENTYDEKYKLYIREKENLISKIKDLESSIALTNKKIKLKGKEVDYVLSRFNEKKDTIMSYYRQLDEFEYEKIKLKKIEREHEYYTTYIAILN